MTHPDPALFVFDLSAIEDADVRTLLSSHPSMGDELGELHLTTCNTSKRPVPTSLLEVAAWFELCCEMTALSTMGPAFPLAKLASSLQHAVRSALMRQPAALSALVDADRLVQECATHAALAPLVVQAHATLAPVRATEEAWVTTHGEALLDRLASAMVEDGPSAVRSCIDPWGQLLDDFSPSTPMATRRTHQDRTRLDGRVLLHDPNGRPHHVTHHPDVWAVLSYYRRGTTVVVVPRSLDPLLARVPPGSTRAVLRDHDDERVLETATSLLGNGLTAAAAVRAARAIERS